MVKNEGDTVAKGDILRDRDRQGQLEVESFFEGTLIKIIVRESITVPVNTVVGYIGEKGERCPTPRRPPPLRLRRPGRAPAAPSPS